MTRDRWAWAVLLGALPLAIKLIGAPAGEPVAEDFDFLRRALLTSNHSLLDGGGSVSFWRPLSHQLYYLAFGRLILAAPWAIAAVHVLLLVAGALFLYRALRRDPAWPGWAAASAATFPLLAESTRTIVSWPTQFVDLGVFLFSALALHERSRGRMWSALLALVAALLCKEVAIVTAAMLAWWPDRERLRRGRWTWTIAAAVVTAAWAGVYLWVRREAGLTLPHQIETDPAVMATPLLEKLWWSTWNSLRAVMSLALRPGRWDLLAGAASAALLAGAIVVMLRRKASRGALADSAPWIAWGLVWFALASATLAAIFPLWQPNRSQFGSVGLGIAVVALLRIAGPWFVAGAVVLRAALVLLGPPPAAIITREVPDRGAFMDFERLTRLQRLMREIRTTLQHRYPWLPGGTTLVQHNLPYSAVYALGGSYALQTWYRDTTVHWSSFADFGLGRVEKPLTVVEFELQPPQITLVDPAVMSGLVAALALADAGRYEDAVSRLDSLERIPIDPHSRVARASMAGIRATSLAAIGRFTDAEAHARRAVALYPRNPDARFVLGLIAFREGRLEEAEGHFDTLLLERPEGDSLASRLLERVREARLGR